MFINPNRKDSSTTLRPLLSKEGDWGRSSLRDDIRQVLLRAAARKKLSVLVVIKSIYVLYHLKFIKYELEKPIESYPSQAVYAP
jgi:hypothetical protein